MKNVLKLFDQMEDELKGAEEYLKCAYKYREDDRLRSETYFKMANGELEHYRMLDGMMKSHTEKYKGGEGHITMKTICEWESDKLDELLGKINTMISQYNKA